MTAPTQHPRPGGRSTVLGRGATSWPPPPPHPSGATPPRIPAALVPKHVAIVMDGNGRWAHARGLSRTEGHRAGEASLMDVLHGAIELGVSTVSAYAFSTENWRRSPEEVRFLMGFNKDVIRRRRDELAALGVRIRWAGRRPRLWRSVISQLEDAENHTRGNDRLTLQFCVNYGGRAEIVDAVRAISRDVQAGVINPAKIDERTIGAYLDEPGLPDVDLFIRTSGEQRTSNFLLWQSAYAELAFVDTPWPDFDRRHFWQACLEYAQRDRRFGGAGQVEPSGGAGSVEPSGGAGQVEPSGGAGQVEPSGGAGQVEPSGGAGSVEPSGGAGSVEPDALVVSPSSPQDGPA